MWNKFHVCKLISPGYRYFQKLPLFIDGAYVALNLLTMWHCGIMEYKWMFLCSSAYGQVFQLCNVIIILFYLGNSVSFFGAVYSCKRACKCCCCQKIYIDEVEDTEMTTPGSQDDCSSHDTPTTPGRGFKYLWIVIGTIQILIGIGISASLGAFISVSGCLYL